MLGFSTAGWEAISRFAAAQGADIRLSYAREDPYPWFDNWCIPQKAPNEDAAYAWIDRIDWGGGASHRLRKSSLRHGEQARDRPPRA
jgi:hypothetical protein